MAADMLLAGMCIAKWSGCHYAGNPGHPSVIDRRATMTGWQPGSLRGNLLIRKRSWSGMPETEACR